VVIEKAHPAPTQQTHGDHQVASRVLTLSILSFSFLIASMEVRAANVAGAIDDWPSHGGGVDEGGFSRLEQITSSNATRLGLAWSLALPGEATLEATPLAVNGVLYFTGSYAAVYAVDGASGKLLWKYDPEVWKHNPTKMMFSFAVNRGVAYAEGRVFGAALDGRLFALDAKTGKLLWSRETTSPQSMETITGAPIAFNGKVIIGNAGADVGARGYVTAYHAATGKQAWRFYTAPGTPEQNRGDPVMERAAATWRGEYWKTGTGGGVWDAITFDPEFNRVYLGTANAAPYDPETRSPGGGDNLYTASIVAVEADSGKYAWHYQINPRDSWDYDCAQGMITAALTIDGRLRRVLMQAPKNGFFYVIDRETGKPISAGKIGKVTWAERIDVATGRPVEAKNIRYEKGEVTIWPSPLGAHNWQAMSFSPNSNLVYIPYMQVGARFHKGDVEPGEIAVGGLNIGWSRRDPEDGKGALVAWDPIQQKPRWKVQHDTLWNGGTLATAGNLVFQGTADGYFAAYDALTGRRVWRFNAGLGIIAAPMSYSVDGKQFVSILVGYGGSAAIGSNLMDVGWKYGAQPRTLLTFALDGKAVRPASAPPTTIVNALDDPSLRLNDADVAAGRALFIACAVCHGRDLVSAGSPGPDLRESKLALQFDSLWSVVHDGTLLKNGMPGFPTLTREQVTQIHAYVRAGAREVLKSRAQQNSSVAPQTH
jgi:quinohemoprotein ethanol dehydrogenase